MPLRLSGLISGMDTEAMVAELMKAQRQRTTKLENKVTTLDWKQEKWKALNTKIYSFYTGSLSKLRFQGNYNTKAVSTTADSLVTVTANNNAVDGTHTLKVKQLASSQYVTGDTLEKDNITRNTLLSDLDFATDDNNTITIKGSKGTVDLKVESTTTVGNFIDSLKSAGINASYDSTQKRFFLSSQSSGVENAFELKASTTGSLEKLGLGDITKKVVDGNTIIETSNTEVKVVNPADAIVYYNGAELKGATNTISANGLTLQLKGITSGLTTSDTADDQVINLNVSRDTKAAYDMIKNFVKGYNELLKEMNDSYYAEAAKGYSPLSEEQKEAMTDSQIEKWEDKIKNSLLRRDSSLISVMNSMKGDLTGNVTIDGKNYALSNYGIGTLDYTEKGLLHIDGDSEDAKVSGNADKLMKALSENPDQVVKVFSSLAETLYQSLTDKMKSTTLRSALTVYNDKEMVNTQRDQKDKLKQLEAKLATLESKYYKQFSKMESAMAELNSKSSSLASMLGQN